MLRCGRTGYDEKGDPCLLNGRGAYRVHGGGFAGTVQAFVPLDMLDDFKAGIEAVLSDGSCHVLRIRPDGGIRVQ